jgi:heme-degrading monooxygenase HmoA
MIARTWRGETIPANADRYLRFVTEKVFPSLKSIAGHRGAYVLRRDAGEIVEFQVLTFWDSMEAIRKFAGENPEAAVIAAEARSLLTDFDQHVRHFEVAHDSVVG